MKSMRATMKSILQYLGLAPTPQDEKLVKIVENSYHSLRLVGRGPVRIDPEEVYNSAEFQKALKDAKEIVEGNKR